MSSNVTKFGRLPPISDLGLGPLPQKSTVEVTEKLGADNGASRNPTYHYEEKNGLQRAHHLDDSCINSPDEQRDNFYQSAVLIKSTKTKNHVNGSKKREETKIYKRKGQADSFHVKQHGDLLAEKDLKSNGQSPRGEEVQIDVSQMKSDGSYDSSHKELHVNEGKILNRFDSKLTEETTIDGSGIIDNPERPANVDYREMAIRLANSYSRPSTSCRKRRLFTDYLLVFDQDDDSEYMESQREKFEKLLYKEGMQVHRIHAGKHVYVEICCSFERLCQEAEAVFLEMPLIGLSLHHDNTQSTSRWKVFESEKEVDDICIPFCNATKEIYDGVNDKNKFFRPGIRSLLVHEILKKIKMDESDKAEQHNVEALAYLLHSDVYRDAFILHERSSLDPCYPLELHKRMSSVEYPTECEAKPIEDPRKDLHETWLSNFKFQPLWKIRNYFGEKIALYFAWLGMLSTSLWIPTFIGLVVFIYGIIYAFATKTDNSWSRTAFDNDLTPGFALIICLWGTVFLELWKRKNARLAYKWDVDDFEEQEPNRPQFHPSDMQLNPITGLYEPFYSPVKKTLKTMGSMMIIFFMVLLVVGSVISVIVYRIVSRVDWFTGANAALLSNVTSSVLNSTSIMLLGFLYKHLGERLTKWENHRTQTQFEDSLILKLFGFQFVNSYASLYYIAFFRERTKDGILGKGEQYTDSCGTSNDCMSLLSLQVGVLMLMKPMPKFFSDVILPLLLKLLRSIRHKMRRNKVLDESSFVDENVHIDVEYEDYIKHESKKPGLDDFTLSEYTEKVIQYGYLMLFAAACPLAPLIALVTNLVDLRIDARRLLWLNRRPIPFRAQDIGMWFTILQLLNYIGVITNGFIIAIASSFGRKYKTTTVFNVVSNNTSVNSTTGVVHTTTETVTTLEYLWIIIVFQNVSFIVRFVLEYSIPDEPESLRLARKKERFVIDEVLKKAGFRRGRGKSIVPAISKTSQSREQQIVISNVSKRKKDSMKDKIRRISKHSSGKKKRGNSYNRWKNEIEDNRRNEVDLNGGDLNEIGQSEV